MAMNNEIEWVKHDPDLNSKEWKGRQDALFEMLRSFNTMMTCLDIRYFLFAGTLLGCYRHGDFLPWDDDVDIAMTRSEYERLRSELKDMTGPFYILDPRDNPKYKGGVHKVCYRPYMITSSKNEPWMVGQGLFIDIFILDYAPDIVEDAIKYFCWYEKKFWKPFKAGTYWSKELFSNWGYKRKLLFNHLKFLLKGGTVGLVRKSEKLQLSKIPTNHYGIFNVATRKISQHWFPVEWFRGRKRMKIREWEFPVPFYTLEVLSTEFPDWDKIPTKGSPYTKHSHEYNFRSVKNGSEIY